jgi:hypothetical protein
MGALSCRALLGSRGTGKLDWTETQLKELEAVLQQQDDESGGESDDTDSSGGGGDTASNVGTDLSSREHLAAPAEEQEQAQLQDDGEQVAAEQCSRAAPQPGGEGRDRDGATFEFDWRSIEHLAAPAEALEQALRLDDG